MSLVRACRALVVIASLWSPGCAEADPRDGSDFTGAGIEVSLVALNLLGVGDVVWDVEVVSGATPAGAVVWQRRITSSGYGDGAGSASFVGPCDAGAAADQSVVNVWVVGLYDAPVAAADAGAFSAGAASGAGAVAGDPLSFHNPTAAGPLTRAVTCQGDADVSVRFDVSLMRPAEQGFFDVAVSFNNIFCSAKLDCCTDDDGTPGCAGDGSEDITLLYDGAGERTRTFVMGFACTAGASPDVATHLYMDDLELDCSAPNAGPEFSPDLVLDPSGAPGNQCVASALSDCDAVVTGAAMADDYFHQVAVFRGEGRPAGGGGAAETAYWNVALGVKPAISACRLRARATADDAANADDGAVDGVITAGVVYPFVRWDVALGTCGSEPLTAGSTSAPVTTAYTGVGDGATTYAHRSPPAEVVALDLIGNGVVTEGLLVAWDPADVSLGPTTLVDVSGNERHCTIDADRGATRSAADAAAGVFTKDPVINGAGIICAVTTPGYNTHYAAVFRTSATGVVVARSRSGPPHGSSEDYGYLSAHASSGYPMWYRSNLNMLSNDFAWSPSRYNSVAVEHTSQSFGRHWSNGLPWGTGNPGFARANNAGILLGGNSYRGTIGPVMIYGRSLDDAEVLQNHRALRAYAIARGYAYADVLDN